MDTKTCPFCDASVGTSEEKCPKCGFDFSQFDEETINNFERVSAIVEKRRKKKEEEEKRNQPPTPPAEPPKKKGFFDSLKGRK